MFGVSVELSRAMRLQDKFKLVFQFCMRLRKQSKYWRGFSKMFVAECRDIKRLVRACLKEWF